LQAQAREGLFSETLNQINGIDNRAYFGTLDGQLLFADGLQAAAKEGLLQDGQVKALQKQLADIAPGSRPSPFYAVLRMDGDSVGKLLNTAPNPLMVSKALAAFATQVRSVVDNAHDGATLYAGGDDVLALLPLDTAIACAKALQQAYHAAMQGQGLAGTISAAIVFAHYHIPLSFVIAESARLLDDVAKTQNGRNSLAMAVYKPGGQHLEWASRWDDSGTTAPQPVQTLCDLVGKFNPTRTSNKADLPLSSGFLYRIRERWGDLNTRNAQGQPVLQFTDAQVKQLWAADLLANRDLGEINDQTRSQANDLAAQLFVISQNNPNRAAASSNEPLLSESGGLLVRFLATKGVQA
jgi:CRISPR-associated protein Cmr2